MDKTGNIFAWLGEREGKNVPNLALQRVEKSCERVIAMKGNIESLTRMLTAKNRA